MTDKGLLNGNTTMLILKLLECEDMYGYQMIDELAERSDKTFSLKAGTLYPLLHGLERQGMVVSYDKTAENLKVRKYYSITKEGRKLLDEKRVEWKEYTGAVNKVLRGNETYATI